MLFIKILVNCWIVELLFYVMCGVNNRFGSFKLVSSGLFLFVGLWLNIFFFVLVICFVLSVIINVFLFIKLLWLVLINNVLGFIIVSFCLLIRLRVWLVSG